MSEGRGGGSGDDVTEIRNMEADVRVLVVVAVFVVSRRGWQK